MPSLYGMIVGIMPFRIFLDLCLLRANPQDLPSSNRLLGIALVAHLAANVLTGIGEANLENALIAGAMDTLLLVALTHTGLMLRNLRERARQVLTALAGSGALIGVCIWVTFAVFEVLTPYVWVRRLFLLWFIGVYGHVLRHSFNVTLGVGLLFATGYVLLSLLVTGPFLLSTTSVE